MKKNSMRSVRVLVFTAGFILLLYLAMLLSTTPVVRHVKAVFRGEIPRSDVSACLEQYDITENRPRITDVKIKVRRRFVLHNFNNGYMWVRFECEAFDSGGNLIYGEVNYPKWSIRKVNGEWEIVDVEQDVF